MRHKDAMSLGLATVNNAFINLNSTQGTSNGGYPTVTVSINNQTVQGDTNVSVPLAMPFGLLSVPADGTYAITMNFQSGTLSPVAISQIPAFANYFPLTALVPGESALYSYFLNSTTGYSLHASLKGVYAHLQNTLGNNTATMLYGENIVKTLVDIITYLDSLSSWLVGFQNAYNTGTVPYSATIPSTGTIDSDKSGLQAGKGYVNNTGEPM